LSRQPAVLNDQFADVLDQQLQQIEQTCTQFGTVFGQELKAECQSLDIGQQGVDCCR